MHNRVITVLYEQWMCPGDISEVLAERDIYIGIVEKTKETSSDSGMHNRVITVLYEQWMCPGPTSHCVAC